MNIQTYLVNHPTIVSQAQHTRDLGASDETIRAQIIESLLLRIYEPSDRKAVAERVIKLLEVEK